MDQAAKVRVRIKQNVGIIELSGEVTSQAEQDVTEAFQKLEREGLKKFLLKFNETTYINSSGLAIVINIVSEARKKKEQFAASGMSKHFEKVFDMIGLTDYIAIVPTEDEAIRKL